MQTFTRFATTTTNGAGTSYLELGNPAASGKLLVIKEITLIAEGTLTAFLGVTAINGAGANNASQPGIIRHSTIGVAGDSAAILFADTAQAFSTGEAFIEVDMTAANRFKHTFIRSVAIREGEAFVFFNATTSTNFRVTVEYDEIDI